MKEGVSVVVCCYNSSKRIKETLYFLSKQESHKSLLWEILILDNCSTDNTRAISEEYWQTLNSEKSIRFIDVPTPGLSAARQRGVNEAQYSIIVFCDDDNHLDVKYVSRSYQLMTLYDNVGIIGGWVKPKLARNPGNWIADFYPALAIGMQGEGAQYVKWVFGAGMVIRKEIFDKLNNAGIKLMLSDRVGFKQTSGGDAELCVIVSFLGYQIYYSPELQMHHAISPHRLSKSAFIKANYLNVFAIVYMFLVERISVDQSIATGALYKKCILERLKMIIHFTPRVFLGKHNFYSFIMLYQSIQLFFWLVFRKKRFYKTASDIELNLYSGKK